MLEATQRVVRKTNGVIFEQFENDEDLLDICAMQYQFIGNCADSLYTSFQL